MGEFCGRGAGDGVNSDIGAVVGVVVVAISIVRIVAGRMRRRWWCGWWRFWDGGEASRCVVVSLLSFGVWVSPGSKLGELSDAVCHCVGGCVSLEGSLGWLVGRGGFMY